MLTPNRPHYDEMLELYNLSEFSSRFVLYVVSTDDQRDKLISTISEHSATRNMPIEYISIVNDDIDGDVIVKDGAGCHDFPKWWHEEPFFLLVNDFFAAADNHELYPKVSRLISMTPDSTYPCCVNRRPLPEHSQIRAVITAAEINKTCNMIDQLSKASIETIQSMKVELDHEENWRQVDKFATIETLTLEKTIIDFLYDYLKNPYRCYTEHGQHALFFSMLYNNLPLEMRDLKYNGYNVCVIQKEYPTNEKIGKRRRQNWDISLIKSSAISQKLYPNSYDYLSLSAVVEFGLNEKIKHLIDDFLRLSHPDANVDHRYIVHLYRVSDAENRNSGRDWSENASELKEWVLPSQKTYHETKLIKILKKLSVGGTSNITEVLSDYGYDELRSDGEKLQEKFEKVTFYVCYVNVSAENKCEILYKVANGLVKELPKR